MIFRGLRGSKDFKDFKDFKGIKDLSRCKDNNLFLKCKREVEIWHKEKRGPCGVPAYIYQL
jgi:hypothetical protein